MLSSFFPSFFGLSLPPPFPPPWWWWWWCVFFAAGFMNPMIACDACNVHVHAWCYGLKDEDIPDGDWFCARCESTNAGIPVPATCAVCPGTVGAMHCERRDSPPSPRTYAHSPYTPTHPPHTSPPHIRPIRPRAHTPSISPGRQHQPGQGQVVPRQYCTGGSEDQSPPPRRLRRHLNLPNKPGWALARSDATRRTY